MENDVSPQPQPKTSRRIFGLIVLAIGVALAVPFGYEVMKSAGESTGWAHTDGTIRDSELVTVEQRDGSILYRAHIVYAYSVNGREYEAERIRFGTEESASSVQDRAARWVEAYPPGKQVIVYYDPQSPADAVLEPGAYEDAYVLLVFGIVLTVAGATLAARK